MLFSDSDGRRDNVLKRLFFCWRIFENV